MEDLGFVQAETIEFGALERPELLAMRVGNAEKQVSMAFLTLTLAEVAASFLAYAQKQAVRLPEGQADAMVHDHLTRRPGNAVEAKDVLFDPTRKELLINVGIGVMRYKLVGDALKKFEEQKPEE